MYSLNVVFQIPCKSQVGRLLYELLQARRVDASTRSFVSVDWPYMNYGQANPLVVAIANNSASPGLSEISHHYSPEMEMRTGDIIGRYFLQYKEGRPGFWIGMNKRTFVIGEYPLNKVVQVPLTVRYRAFELAELGNIK